LRKQWQNFKERLIENYTNHIKEYIEDNELPFSFTIETNHIVDDIFDLTIKFNEKDFDTQYIVDSSKD
ncbi:hypothetical protein, partial [Streptomyces niveiscabiei]|uniref:hypothetical protein n=1 Tax=Streptomyces niveiscabiei TaxID=164115 RepID=UPI0038F6632C